MFLGKEGFIHGRSLWGTCYQMENNQMEEVNSEKSRRDSYMRESPSCLLSLYRGERQGYATRSDPLRNLLINVNPFRFSKLSVTARFGRPRKRKVLKAHYG